MFDCSDQNVESSALVDLQNVLVEGWQSSKEALLLVITAISYNNGDWKPWVRVLMTKGQ